MFMKFLLSLLAIAVGALIVIYSEKIFKAFGSIPWADKHLGTEGGSRLFYKLIGIAIILVAFLYMSGTLQDIGNAIFGRLFGF